MKTHSLATISVTWALVLCMVVAPTGVLAQSKTKPDGDGCNHEEPPAPTIPSSPSHTPPQITPPTKGVVEIEKQVFREGMAISGTPFGLHYTSWRVPGNLSAYEQKVNIFPEDQQKYYSRIVAGLSVAGQTQEYPGSNEWYRFQWNGLDGTGEAVDGARKALLYLDYDWIASGDGPMYDYDGGGENTYVASNGYVWVGGGAVTMGAKASRYPGLDDLPGSIFIPAPDFDVAPCPKCGWKFLGWIIPWPTTAIENPEIRIGGFIGGGWERGVVTTGGGAGGGNSIWNGLLGSSGTTGEGNNWTNDESIFLHWYDSGLTSTDGINIELNGAVGQPSSSSIRTIGVALSSKQGLGGWTVTPNHYYDATGEILYMGSGQVWEAKPIWKNLAEDTNTVRIVSKDGSLIYTFNTRGFHLRTQDAITGLSIYEFAYDDDDRLLSITDADGLHTTFAYSLDQITITAPFGQQTVVNLGEDGYVASLVNPVQETNWFAYAEGGLLTNVVSRRGNAYGITYDEAGRVTHVDFPNGHTEDYSRADAYMRESFNFSEGSRVTRHVTQTRSDGTLRSVVAPNGRAGYSHLETWYGVTDQYQYSDGTSIIVTNHPDPRFGYRVMQPQSGRLTLPSGRSLEMESEFSMLLADLNDPMSIEAVARSVAINGLTSHVQYAAADGLLSSKSPSGRIASMQLDADQRPQTISIPGLYDVELVYDASGRVQRLQSGSGDEARHIEFSYNEHGYLQSVQNPIGGEFRLLSDPIGRVTNLVGPDSETIALEYDRSHYAESIQPPGKPAHRFSYDAVGNTTEYAPPALGEADVDTQYTWDLNWQLTSIRWPDGQVLTNEYDEVGLLTASQWPENRIELEYDPDSMRPFRVASTNGDVLAWTWDGFLPTQMDVSGSVTGSIVVDYDENLNLSHIALNGQSVAYQYDADGLLTCAGGLELSRNALNGLLEGSSLGTVADGRQYNGFGELTAYLAQTDNEDILAVEYAYDGLGQIVRQTEEYGSETITTEYEYDLGGRLARVLTNGNLRASYTYDANGNRTNAVVEGETFVGTYDAQDRLLSYGDTTYTYNNHGTLAAKTQGDSATAYTYDACGSLLAVAEGTNTIAYSVDPMGRRIAREKNGETTHKWLYQGFLSPIAELDADNNLRSRFVYATRANVPDYMVRDGQTYRLITDIRGSVRMVVNTATGETIQRMDYDEWGNVVEDTNPGFQPFGFAGGLYDPDTALVRFGYRDYDPSTGRWTAKDPILFDGEQTNLYLYCDGDPINWADPDGLILINIAIGVTVSLIQGAVTSWVLGEKYTWKKAAIDVGVGALGGGIGAVRNIASAVKIGRSVQRAAKAQQVALMLTSKMDTMDDLVRAADIVRKSKKIQYFGNLAVADKIGSAVSGSISEFGARQLGNILNKY